MSSQVATARGQCAVRLRTGEIVLIDGRRLITGSLIGGVRTFTDFSHPELQVPYSQSAIDNMTRERRLLIEARCHDLPRHLREALTRALETYSQEHLAYMDRALVYCKDVDKAGPRLRLTKKGLSPIIAETAIQIDDKEPWSWNTIRKLYLRWITSGRDPRSLLPGWGSRGNRNRRRDHWVHELATDFLNRKWLVNTAPNIAFLKPRFLKELAAKAAELGVATPELGKNFLYRKAGEYEEYTKLYHRHSKRDADHAIRNVGRGPQGEFAGEAYEIDHTPLDIMVRDEKSGLILPKPFLTVILDRYSRLIIGFCISFHPPSWLTVMLALKMGLGNKQAWLAQFNGINGPWPDTGAPLGFVCDRGKEFESSSMDTTILRIGAEIVDLPRRRPDLKGKVEAYLDTLQKGTIHNLDGTTFRNIDKRGEYLSSKNAIFSVRSIQWIVTKFVVDVSNQRPHAGIMNEIPLARWNASVEKWGRRPSVDDQLLTAFLGKSGQSQADRRGIQIDHLFYNSKKLAKIRSECAKLGARTDSKKPVNVMLWRARDLVNLGAIQVLDPISERWISIECTWPDYAEGRTHRQHRVTVDRLNALGRKINEENLLEAMNAIHDEIDDIKANRKRSGQMKEIARFEDTGPRPQDTIEPSQFDPVASAEPLSEGLGKRTTRVRRSKATKPSYGPDPRPEKSPDASPPKSSAPSDSEHTVDPSSPTISVDAAEAETPNLDSQPGTIAREARAKAFHKIEDL